MPARLPLCTDAVEHCLSVKLQRYCQAECTATEGVPHLLFFGLLSGLFRRAYLHMYMYMASIGLLLQYVVLHDGGDNQRSAPVAGATCGPDLCQHIWSSALNGSPDCRLASIHILESVDDHKTRQQTAISREIPKVADYLEFTWQLWRNANSEQADCRAWLACLNSSGKHAQLRRVLLESVHQAALFSAMVPCGLSPIKCKESPQASGQTYTSQSTTTTRTATTAYLLALDLSTGSLQVVVAA